MWNCRPVEVIEVLFLSENKGVAQIPKVENQTRGRDAFVLENLEGDLHLESH